MGTLGTRLLTDALLLAAGIVCLSFVDGLHPLVPQLAAVQRSSRELWATIGPGGRLHPASFIEHQGHLVVEGLLLAVISYLLFQSSYKPAAKAAAPLTDKEIDELCEEWEPEPLWGPADPPQGPKPVVLSSETGTQVVADGRRALNMASFNFLGIAGDEGVRRAAHATIAKYGVGSCGPRGFYGTIDVHLQLEERLAAFMGTQEAILYSYDLATLPSVLPAFANKRDLIVADEAVNFGIQNGCCLSRARVLYFKHNDVADLERLLRKVAEEDRRTKRPLNRRFIVVEGIYAHTGELAPLGAIRELKERYRYRLVIDESLSLGVLGATGRGAAELWGIAPGEAEIIGASMGNALASVGGFCAGDREMVDHQRLSGLGYCFSASLPPYLATAGIAALDILESQGSKLLPRLAENAAAFRQLAAEIPQLEVVGGKAAARSPVVHLRLAPAAAASAGVAGPADWPTGDALLQRVADDCLQRQDVLVATAKYSKLERGRLPPSLRVAVSAAHSAKDLEAAAAALAASCNRVLS